MSCDAGQQLRFCIDEINKYRKGRSLKYGFPSGKLLSNASEVHLSIIVEQAEILLSGQGGAILGGAEFWREDRDRVISLFLDDLLLFCTENDISIDRLGAHFGQKIITNRAIFHIASCCVFPKTYGEIDLLDNKRLSDIYSAPFFIRVALEGKLKEVIGFGSCDVSRDGKFISGVDEFPFKAMARELDRLKCLDLPCGIPDIINIYSWCSDFCHTGSKGYIWLILKALDTLSPLFSHSAMKAKEVDIYLSWGVGVLRVDVMREKMVSHKGSLRPVSYFKKGWWVGRLQDVLNKSKSKSLSCYRFYLSERNLGECYGFFCEKRKEYF